MAEQFHHDPRVNSLRQQKSGRAVPEIVKSDSLDLTFRVSDDSVKLAQHVPRVEHRAHRGSEDHTALAPRVAGKGSFLLLAHLVRAEGCDCYGWKRYGPAASLDSRAFSMDWQV
jgi:hypothetical protein